MYACIPHKLLKVSEDRNSEWKKALQNAARKYFKEPNSIEICVSENSRIQLFIMEKPKYAGSEDSIRSDLTDQVHSLYPDAEVDIKIMQHCSRSSIHRNISRKSKRIGRNISVRKPSFNQGKGNLIMKSFQKIIRLNSPVIPLGRLSCQSGRGWRLKKR